MMDNAKIWYLPPIPKIEAIAFVSQSWLQISRVIESLFSYIYSCLHFGVV